jgi:hypothetical protein
MDRIQCTAPLSPELTAVLQHQDMKDLWEVAKVKDPRLTLELTDEKGGTFGRNYRRSS